MDEAVTQSSRKSVIVNRLSTLITINCIVTHLKKKSSNEGWGGVYKEMGNLGSQNLCVTSAPSSVICVATAFHLAGW